MSKNTTQIRAAVVREKGGPFGIETLSLEGPRRDEVLVKVLATGLCHTDMVARDKGYPVPHPIVLGHEGAGIVESVGADVVKVAPGDSVVLTFLTCGRCKPCRLRQPPSPMNATWSRSAVTYRSNASVRSAAEFRPEPGR